MIPLSYGLFAGLAISILLFAVPATVANLIALAIVRRGDKHRAASTGLTAAEISGTDLFSVAIGYLAAFLLFWVGLETHAVWGIDSLAGSSFAEKAEKLPPWFINTTFIASGLLGALISMFVFLMMLYANVTTREKTMGDE